MANDVINLFGNDGQEEVDYAQIFMEFVKPFEDNPPKGMEQMAIYDVGIQAWNVGNIYHSMPEPMFEAMRMESEQRLSKKEKTLMDSMVKRRIKDFNEDIFFITDIEPEFQKKGGFQFKLTVMGADEFLEDIMAGGLGEFDDIENEQEGIVDRDALIVRPKQAFVDWINSIYPDETVELSDIDEPNIYLFDSDVEYRLEEVLEDNFAFIFERELNGWHTFEEAWPQKRTLQLFLEFFSASFSTMVYDVESMPVSKRY